MRHLLLPCLLLVGCGDPAVEPPAAPPPNVILVSLDTLRWDHVGTYGYERNTTPFLDEFATQALVFERAYTTWCFTLIAHMSMLTGLYPEQHGVWDDRSVLAAPVRTVAEQLQELGYHTVSTYRQRCWLEPVFGFDRGFDVYEPHRHVRHAEDQLRKMVSARPKDKPLFLFLHLFDIHSTPLTRWGPIYDAPMEYANEFLEGSFELANSAPLSESEFKRMIWSTKEHQLSDEQLAALTALYDGGIRHTDEKLRELFTFLERQGVLENALVIITSDHGEGLGQRSARLGGHGGTYEEGLRVPLIVRYPGADRPTGRVPERVSHVDIAATILDYCGVKRDHALEGQPLHEPIDPDRLLFAQSGKIEVVWGPELKVAQNVAGALRSFDLDRDPLERTQQDVDPQSKAMALWELGQADQQGWVRFDAAVREQRDLEHEAEMAGLGYTGDDED